MPQRNRLNLNFQLASRSERNQFIKSYLESIQFMPTSAELEMMGKYILWGQNENGENGRQEGLQLETASKTWDKKTPKSLDALIESPTFNEASIRSGPFNPPTKAVRETFSRERTRQFAPPHILPTFEDLWRRIDETELLISLYELNVTGKRTKPIRPELLNRFSPSDLNALQMRANSLQPFNYLKLKHQLVELRNEQYTIKDSYAPVILSQFVSQPLEFQYETFETEIPVYPFGIKSATSLSQKIFRSDRFPEPNDFTQAELEQISSQIWTRPAQLPQFHFDFRNADHLYALFNVLGELREAEPQLESNLNDFLNTLDTYVSLARLSPILTDILELKIQHKTNQQISDIINDRYGKSYKPNYISTLYCKKCLGGIIETVLNHMEVLENIFFKENFKRCKDCGRVLLLNEKNFVKRHRSNDGFSPRCKECEKKNRTKRS